MKQNQQQQQQQPIKELLRTQGIATDQHTSSLGTESSTQGMIPPSIRAEMESGVIPEPRDHDNITILVVEIPEFEKVTQSLDASSVFKLIEWMQTAFDEIIANYGGLYKLNSIADKFLVCTGLTSSCTTASASVGSEQTEKEEEILEETLEALKCAKEFQDAMEGFDLAGIGVDEELVEKLNIRIGVHTGPVYGVGHIFHVPFPCFSD
jgi:class 3 adenylate cyclase